MKNLRSFSSTKEADRPLIRLIYFTSSSRIETKPRLTTLSEFPKYLAGMNFLKMSRAGRWSS